MRRVIIASVVSLLTLFISHSLCLFGDEGTESWKEYQNEEFGFKIQLPSSFQTEIMKKPSGKPNVTPEISFLWLRAFENADEKDSQKFGEAEGPTTLTVWIKPFFETEISQGSCAAACCKATYAPSMKKWRVTEELDEGCQASYLGDLPYYQNGSRPGGPAYQEGQRTFLTNNGYSIQIKWGYMDGDQEFQNKLLTVIDSINFTGTTKGIEATFIRSK